jgi:hypothetical protein
MAPRVIAARRGIERPAQLVDSEDAAFSAAIQTNFTAGCFAKKAMA